MMSRRSKRLPNLTGNSLIESIEKNKLSKNQRLKVTEKFNQYRRAGGEFITREQIINVLDSLGKTPTPEELQVMIGTEDTIDQARFQQIINDYKVFTEGSDDALLMNVFEQLSDPMMDKVKIANLIESLSQNFGIDITDFIDQNKFYLTFQQFKSLFT